MGWGRSQVIETYGGDSFTASGNDGGVEVSFTIFTGGGAAVATWAVDGRDVPGADSRRFARVARSDGRFTPSGYDDVGPAAIVQGF